MSSRQMKGILGTKLGMTQVFDENNRIVPVTVVKAGPNVVTQIRTQDNDGYTAVQLAFGEIKPRKVNKPEKGHFAKAGVTHLYCTEFRRTRATVEPLGETWEETADLVERPRFCVRAPIRGGHRDLRQHRL